MHAIGRPGSGEYAPYFERYVGLVLGDDPVGALEEQLVRVRGALAGVAEELAGHRYAPDKWTVREVLGHVVDSERVFGYRALSFARGAESALPGFDEETFAAKAGHDAIPLGDLLGEFEHVRRGHLSFFRHLGREAWGRAGVANGNATSVRALAFIMAGHADHHLSVLRERYGVPRPAGGPGRG